MIDHLEVSLPFVGTHVALPLSVYSCGYLSEPRRPECKGVGSRASA